ncbi:hypothetical protein, partial [Chloroflexus sp.]|uniref:hypothetical protein n=1 Tax=Chloroflexus sp. TaxID=1904827 RepID=UPI002ACE80C2
MRCYDRTSASARPQRGTPTSAVVMACAATTVPVRDRGGVANRCCGDGLRCYDRNKAGPQG